MTLLNINRSAVFVFTLGIYLSSALSAHADNFVLPLQIDHAGLTFTQPITFDKPTNFLTNKTEIEC